MLKYALLAGVMISSVPAMAQDKVQATPAAPATQTAPVTTGTAVDPVAAPVADAARSSPAADPAAQPAASPTQVADIVGQEFATYDKDADGTLSKAEFTDWMVALKSASDPKTRAGSPATTAWAGQAFVQADTDNSKSVSKTELTGFLSQG